MRKWRVYLEFPKTLGGGKSSTQTNLVVEIGHLQPELRLEIGNQLRKLASPKGQKIKKRSEIGHRGVEGDAAEE